MGLLLAQRLAGRCLRRCPRRIPGGDAHLRLAMAPSSCLGDIPTWLLVILAAVGGGVALSQLRIQQRQIKEQRTLSTATQPNAAGHKQHASHRGADSNVGVGLVAPYAENASDFPVFDAQFWYARPSGLSDPDNLSVIMPHKQATTTPRFSAARAREQTILTFRDAEGVHWVRMPRRHPQRANPRYGTRERRSHPRGDAAHAAAGHLAAAHARARRNPPARPDQGQKETQGGSAPRRLQSCSPDLPRPRAGSSAAAPAA